MSKPASVAMGWALATMPADEVSCFCCEKARLTNKENRMGKNCFMQLERKIELQK
jgi:hypothetical protein